MSAAQKPVTKIVEFPIREMSIKALTIQPELMQTRAGTDPRVVNVYSRAKASGSVFPPVVVFHTPDDEYLLADGFTRVAAWRSLRLASIRAVIREGTREDAILFGIEANFNPDNIREVTTDDRRHAAEIMIRNEKFRVWSDREIGRRCGVQVATVSHARLRLQSTEGILLPDKIMVFHSGRPTGKLFSYAKRPRSFRLRSNGNYSTQIEGKLLLLGSDCAHAKARFEEITQAIEMTNATLSNSSHFWAWLTKKGILSEGRPTSTMGGYAARDAILFRTPNTTSDAMLANIARAVLTRIETKPDQRVILVGRFGSLTRYPFLAVSLARQLTPPIEFMTPEEVLAEFGPKDNPQPEPSADDEVPS